MKKAKTKSLGHSEDSDDKEMLLAMLIQNAESRGLKGLKYSAYCHSPEGKITHACALGSAHLEDDTREIIERTIHLAIGNDNADWVAWQSNFSKKFFDVEDVGYAYQQAMLDYALIGKVWL